jgi:TetR/AcrR family acrAB operon transcriptional repressor
MARTPAMPKSNSTATSERKTPRPTPKAVATRAMLIELAAEMFSTRGYLQTSIRDIAREASLTTGAIYGHFRNKAELLAEAISSRTETDLESIPSTGDQHPQHVDVLRRAAFRYAERRQLRSLILQGAAAAVTDEETKDRLRVEQLGHLQDWIDRYTANREALDIDPSVDIRDAVLFTWAAEVGLGVLEAVGISPKSKKSWADMSARFGRSLTLPPVD